jgi:hypothetical protein
MLPCLIKKYFEIECPTCGLQRAFYQFIKLDWKGAWQLNPSIFPLIILIVLGIVLLLNRNPHVIKYINGKLILNSFYVFIVTMLVQYVIKFMA